MPDIISIITKRGKLILALTLMATLIAFIMSLLRPKEYLAVATALPANSSTADKARIFNPNIESLYPEIGSADELDRIEGTTKLDTLFIAVADSFDLTNHYSIDKDGETALYKAALTLKKNCDIRRSAYGELKIKVWDGDAALAAQLANGILSKLNEIHQHIQNTNNLQVLEGLKMISLLKQKQADSIRLNLLSFTTNNAVINRSDTSALVRQPNPYNASRVLNVLEDETEQLQKMISQYELSVTTNVNVLMPVEYARPALQADKPKTLQTTLAAFGAAFIFSFLLALFAESRLQKQ